MEKIIDDREKSRASLETPEFSEDSSRLCNIDG